MDFPRQELGALGIITVGSLCVGLSFNSLRPSPLPLVYRSPKDRMAQSVERMSAQAPVSGHWQNVGLDEVQDRVATHRGLVIDARPGAFYRAGHVPGAINLPRADFETVYPRIRAVLEPAKAVEIVVYCSESDCLDSELVADALSRLGYQRLAVYKEGWEEWSRAGLPRETASAQ